MVLGKTEPLENHTDHLKYLVLYIFNVFYSNSKPTKTSWLKTSLLRNERENWVWGCTPTIPESGMVRNKRPACPTG